MSEIFTDTHDIMQHKILLTIDDNHYDWKISASFNGVKAEKLDRTSWQFSAEFQEKNHLEIRFDGKNPLDFPDMCATIKSMIIDYIDVSPVMYQATYYTDHPDWPQICPCTDINLNGLWRLEFSKDVVKETIKNYLGLTNE